MVVQIIVAISFLNFCFFFDVLENNVVIPSLVQQVFEIDLTIKLIKELLWSHSMIKILLWWRNARWWLLVELLKIRDHIVLTSLLNIHSLILLISDRP